MVRFSSGGNADWVGSGLLGLHKIWAEKYSARTDSRAVLRDSIEVLRYILGFFCDLCLVWACAAQLMIGITHMALWYYRVVRVAVKNDTSTCSRYSFADAFCQTNTKNVARPVVVLSTNRLVFMDTPTNVEQQSVTSRCTIQSVLALIFVSRHACTAWNRHVAQRKSLCS